MSNDLGSGTPQLLAEAMWRVVRQGRDLRGIDRLRITGDELELPSVLRVGALAVACVGTTTLAAAELLRDRGGPAGAVSAEVRAACAAFRSERYLRVDGGPAPDLWAPISGDYRTADGGWVRLHANFDHHRDAILRAVGFDPAVAIPAREDVEAAVARLGAVEVESRVVAEGGAAAALRPSAAWKAHEHGREVERLQLVAIQHLDTGAPAVRLPAADRPLAGVRVLDLTRVVAGPVCGRTLAMHGAEVLRVGAAHLPTIEPLVIDTGFGKRFCHLDLRTDDGRATLAGLVREADVFVQAFRPGSLEALGFGVRDLVALNPNLVCASISAYGWPGPWHRRRGFDSLVQMATGLADIGRDAAGGDRPVSLPAQALDHGTGWLAALGVIEALRRRSAEGGGWRVDLSLARTAAFLEALGRVDGLGVPDPDAAVVADLLIEDDTPFGRVRHVAPVGMIEHAPPRWDSPPPHNGADTPTWLPTPV